MQDPPFLTNFIYLGENFPQYVRDRSEFIEEEDSDTKIDAFYRWIPARAGNGSTFDIPALIQEMRDGMRLLDETRVMKVMKAVYCAALCQSPWTLPFIGFIPKKPYALVYKAAGKTTLKEYLEKNKGPGRLVEKDLAKFLIQLAGAMSIAHSHGIVFCCLSTDMIILNEDTLTPYVYNLGDSAIRNYASGRIKSFDDNKFVAPEFFSQDCHFGPKMDVWSLGLIAYCVCKGLGDPFPGETPSETKERLVNRRTKVHFGKLPKGLKLILSKCLEHSPDDRPPLQDIVNKVCQQDVFRDDYIELQKAANMMREVLENQRDYVDQPPLSPNAEKILEELRARRRESQQSKRVLPDVNEMSPERLKQYYDDCKPHLMQSNNDVSDIIELFAKLMAKSDEFAEVLRDRGLFELSLLGLPRYATVAFQYLEYLVINKPSWANENMMPMFNACVHWRTDDTVLLFAYFMSRLKRCSSMTSLVKIVLDVSKQFVASPGAEKLIRAIDRAYRHDGHLKKTFPSEVTEVYITFLESKKPLVVREAYAALLNVKLKDPLRIPVQTLVRDLKNKDLQWSVVLLLAKCRKIHESIMHINIFAALFAAAQKSIDGLYGLCNLARDKGAAETFFMQNMTWLATPLPTWTGTFKLFMVLFEHESFRDKLISELETANLITNVLTSENVEYIMTLAFMLRRAKISVSVHRHIEASGFFSALFEIPQKTRDQNLLIAVIACFDKLAEVQYIDDYQCFVPWLVEQLSVQNDVATAAARTIARLSIHPQLRELLVSYNLVDYYTRLAQDPTFEAASTQFLSQMQA